MSVESRIGGGETSVLRSISRHKLLIVLVAIAFGVAGVLFASLRTAEYAAEAGVLLEDPRSSALLSEISSSRDEDRYVADQISILKSPALLGRAGLLTTTTEDTAGIPARDLGRNTSIRTSEGSNYIVVHFSARDPETAMRGTNAIIRSYRELVRADIEVKTAAALKELDAAISEVAVAAAAAGVGASAERSLLQELRSRRSRLEVDARLAGDGVALFSPATAGRREGASLFTTLIVALVLGGLIGVGLAYVLDAREPGFGRRRAAHIGLRAPTLAEIPDFKQEGLGSVLPAVDSPGTESADAFRFLAAAVGLRRDLLDESVSAKLAESLHDEIPGMTERELAVLDRVASKLDRIALEGQKPASRAKKSKRDLTLRSVAFLSASTGGGTTTLAANTALAAAKAGDRVLMLDGDLWGRGLTRLLLGDLGSLGTPRHNGKPVGLTDMLLRGLLPEGIQLVTEMANGGSLSLIEPGSTTLEAMTSIRTELIRPGLDSTHDDYDRVFIDVPPILQFPYADALVTSSDAVVVVSPYKGDLVSLEQLLDRLDVLGARPIGQVINFVPPREGVRRDVSQEVVNGVEKLTTQFGLAVSKLRARTPSDRVASRQRKDGRETLEEPVAEEPSEASGRWA